ncbi:Imm50 family immunity protein [Caulobacter sp.]|uniref:Imm50 family immunity protein n=1 Tax=Caulobacter sp. TaxID=78 RepID=UPI001B13D29C|nr:Imm50 family immunity protein [Caulobacter sp.]MBO9547006.1 hypothetical protein [Caulobacter sp.]
MNIELLSNVPGGHELVSWFGYAPRFHDAEVLGVTLDRIGATCSIKVHGFEMTREVDAAGFYVCTKHVVVTFLLGDLTSLEFADFNHQNALMGLSIKRGLDGQFRLELDPANGLEGVVEGWTLEISIEPDMPAGSQYQKLG